MKQKTLKLNLQSIENDVEISDGYHTFDELYDHRITLYVALCRTLAMRGMEVWRSKLHSDGSNYEGWFILGINSLPEQQITYHIPLERWDETDFADDYQKAPEWDGHSSQDVLERIKNL